MLLRDDEIIGLLNAECKARPVENPCPPWEAPEETAVLLSARCNDMLKAMFEVGPLYSCPLFYKAEEDIREASYEDLRSECTVNEEAVERLEELEREMGRQR